MNPYPLQLEISGPIALWARPDTLPHPVSYVAPTFSAVKGIFEAILRWKSVNVRPTRCEICAPVQFHRYAFNYGGPLRKSGQIKDGTSLQIFAHADSAGGSNVGRANRKPRQNTVPVLARHHAE